MATRKCCVCRGPTEGACPMCAPCRATLHQGPDQWCVMGGDGSVLSRGSLAETEARRIASEVDPELQARPRWVRYL